MERRRPENETSEIDAEGISTLKVVLPQVFSDGKIDFDKLRTTLGAAAESGPGRFHFSWAGKDDAVSLLQTESRNADSTSGRVH